MSDDFVETVEELDGYINEIGEVTEVVADVADQTIMLVVNANIEAARSGELQVCHCRRRGQTARN